MTNGNAVFVEAVRRRAWHFMSPDVAQSAGISFDELRMFVAGTRTPPREVLLALARRMGLPPPAENLE